MVVLRVKNTDTRYPNRERVRRMIFQNESEVFCERKVFVVFIDQKLNFNARAMCVVFDHRNEFEMAGIGKGKHLRLQGSATYFSTILFLISK